MITYKYIGKFHIGLLLIFIIGVTGCTKNFDKLNTPPDKLIAKDVDASLIGQALAQCQYEGMFGYAFTWQTAQNLFSDLYSQYFATVVDYFDSDQFLEVKSWSNTAWTRFYGTAAPQMFFVENTTRDNNMEIEYAIAKIWKVALYHRITDSFGPIVYFQFGNEQSAVPYDAQEVVYADFFQLLDEAATTLSQATTSVNAFNKSDLLYKGDVDKWRKFANSLRLRLAIRIAYVDPAKAKLEAEKAFAGGVMMDNGDNANVATTDISRHPLATVIEWGEFRMSSTMQSVLTGYNDPRLPVYFSEAESGGGYKGARNGLPKSERDMDVDLYSAPGLMWFDIAKGGSNPPIRVMCASEVYFLRAEGALRGWNMGGTAVDLYNDGIRASLSERTEATPPQIEAYVSSANTPVAPGDAWGTPAMSDIPVAYLSGGDFEKQLEQIITQKWIALYPDGWEAWAERRRTTYPKGYPIFESLNPDVSKDQLMRRFTFALNETDNNLEAVEAARGLLGGPDNNATRLWWDARN